MKPDWRQVPRGDVMPWLAGLHVTLNKEGHNVFNRVTHHRMGLPKAMLLLYDRANNRIGLQPSTPQTHNAYPVIKSGRHGAQMVRAFRVLAEYAIDVPQTLEFTDARIDDDGVLVLDLRTARVSKRFLSRPRVAKDPS
jgi:hypothetical protein